MCGSLCLLHPSLNVYKMWHFDLVPYRGHPWGGIPDYPIWNSICCYPFTLILGYKSICLLISLSASSMSTLGNQFFVQCFIPKVLTRAWHIVGDAPKILLNEWMSSLFLIDFCKGKKVDIYSRLQLECGAAMKHLDCPAQDTKHCAQSLLQVQCLRWVSKCPAMMSSICRSGGRKKT